MLSTHWWRNALLHTCSLSAGMRSACISLCFWNAKQNLYYSRITRRNAPFEGNNHYWEQQLHSEPVWGKYGQIQSQRKVTHRYAGDSNGDVLFCVSNKLLSQQNLAGLQWEFRLFVGTCFLVSPTRLHLNWAAAGQVLDIRPSFLRASPSGSSCGSDGASLRVRFLPPDRPRPDLLHICVFLVNCSM